MSIKDLKEKAPADWSETTRNCTRTVQAFGCSTERAAAAFSALGIAFKKIKDEESALHTALKAEFSKDKQ